jgi:hypothetical protein
MAGPGTTPITVKVWDNAGNTNSCVTSFTVTNAAPTVSSSPASQSVLYGCPITNVTISANDPDSTGSSLVESNWFRFNGGAATAGLPAGLSLAPTGTGVHSATWLVSGNATGSPGTNVVTVTVKDQCGATTTNSFTVIVNPAPTSPVADAYYTGPTFYWTTGPNSSTATLTLLATLKNRTCAGDIRTAKVSFYVRSGTTMTPINGAQNLPVGLVNPGDTSAGTAGATVQYSIGNATAAILDIAVRVTGNYTADDPATDQNCMIAVPVAGGQICGGVTLDNTGSAGYLTGSASDPSVATFFVKYNSSGTNPQGGVEVTVRSYYNRNGVLGTTLHTYKLKSNAISVLAVDNNTHTAQFTSKANVSEIVAGVEQSVEGNCIMQLTMFDGGYNSSADTLGITVQRKNGGIWFSSNWDGTKTVSQPIVTGNLSVN